MPPRQKRSPKYYENKLNEVRAKAAPVLAKVGAGNFDWRDVAILAEYMQCFGDVLDKMIDNPPAIIQDYSEEMAERIIEIWKRNQ